MLQSFLLTNVLFELIVSRSLKVSCSENEFLVTQSVFFVRKPDPRYDVQSPSEKWRGGHHNR